MLLHQRLARRGFVANWDLQRQIWEHAIKATQLVEAEGTQPTRWLRDAILLVTEPIFNFPACQEACQQVCPSAAAAEQVLRSVNGQSADSCHACVQRVSSDLDTLAHTACERVGSAWVLLAVPSQVAHRRCSSQSWEPGEKCSLGSSHSSALQVAFEELGVKGLAMFTPPELALRWQASQDPGALCSLAGAGIVVDAGFSFIHMVPFLDAQVRSLFKVAAGICETRCQAVWPSGPRVSLQPSWRRQWMTSASH